MLVPLRHTVVPVHNCLWRIYLADCKKDCFKIFVISESFAITMPSV